MTRRATRLPALLVAVPLAVLLAGSAAGCGGSDDEGDGVLPDQGTCVGEQDGDLKVDVGSDGAVPEGGNIRIAATRLDDDPIDVDLGIGGGSAADEDSAKDLEIGDTFTLQGRTYRLVGACDDAVWVDEEH